MSTTTANKTASNKPLATVRDGAIKATIWTNPTDKGGVRYSVEISRSYTDADGKWHDTHYFGRNELLRVAHLAGKAYDAIAIAAAGDNSEDGAGQ
ncbi:hypothetical protein Pla108_35640 [Botrimarina colliarenosi]|uniref:Uncharacterized protein n=1 Tax=Botrimarina colliarenosi TaxID=2528001 RepID=A0A5C6A7J8_9BACT|nr:hypothetical protein [Botrimarina colliarenosi]TWT95416.1 hypothetical protein Pla108_35640 [Botrimarina colliarenosi]